MSMADQAKFVDLIKQAIEAYFELAAEEGQDGLGEDNLLPFIANLTQMVADNSKEFLKIVTDPEEVDPETFFNDVTNLQMSEIIKYIVEDNFEAPSKNVMSLFETMKKLFQLKRLSPTSLSDTISTDSDISIEEPLEKED